jgi:hypothetical protein
MDYFLLCDQLLKQSPFKDPLNPALPAITKAQLQTALGLVDAVLLNSFSTTTA